MSEQIYYNTLSVDEFYNMTLSEYHNMMVAPSGVYDVVAGAVYVAGAKANGIYKPGGRQTTYVPGATNAEINK